MSKLATTITRVPMPADVMASIVLVLKAEGYQRSKGLSRFVPQFATALGHKDGTLDKDATYKWFNKDEREAFNALWTTGKPAKRTTASESAKVASKPTKRTFKSDAERMAYVRSCRKSAGKSQPQAVKAQASGKLSESDKLALVADTLAKLAQLLAS